MHNAMPHYNSDQVKKKYSLQLASCPLPSKKIKKKKKKNFSFKFQQNLVRNCDSIKRCKEIQPVHPEGGQSWVFTGRTDAEAETPILWPPHAKSWLTGKDPDAGRDWGHEEKGTTEDEMAGWHHWLNGHGFGWTPGIGDGQGGLVCCDSWGRKESDTTEPLNWTELKEVPGWRIGLPNGEKMI